MKNEVRESIKTLMLLNKVDNFDVAELCRKLPADLNGEERLYLDVVYRKAWFRLKYPSGRLSKKIIRLDERVAVVEARVYPDYKDDSENYISNAFGQRNYDENDQYAQKYLELAETAAIGRALLDAGFGMVFDDSGITFDDMPVDSGVANLVGNKKDNSKNKSGKKDKDNEQSKEGVNDIKSEDSVESEADSTESKNVETSSNVTTLEINNSSEDVPIEKSTETSIEGDSSKLVLNEADEVEELLKKMTYEYAANYVIPVGYQKGKTFKQIAIERPSSLEWYVHEYSGPNNILKAAAKFLIDKAFSEKEKVS